MTGKIYTLQYCLERARMCELLAQETVQEEASSKFRSLAAQWRALANDGDQAPADDVEQLKKGSHINVTASMWDSRVAPCAKN
jgi:hypothetical protein